ncbi:MAG: InlB B-repeat-containing protein [Treponema sp.]|nr:InlB B-repeat-containing protein [Treponema sp.]
MKNFYHEPYEHNELTLRYLHLEPKKSLINYNNFKGIKKRNRTTGSYWLVLFVVSIFFFTSCPEPFVPGNLNLPEGKGSFSLSLSSERTILPAAPALSDFTSYTLVFTAVTGGNDETVNRTNATLASDPVTLTEGTYNLTVTAYKAGNLIAARGTTNGIVIIAGQNNTASVTLHALLNEPGAEGTYKWDITLDTTLVVVSSATMTIFNASGEQQGTAVNLAPSGTTSGERTLATGMYTVSFDLEGTEESENKTVKWDELLYVYATLESSFAHAFTDEYFKKINWKVTFDNNYEGGGSVIQSVLHGGKISRPLTDPQRVKYEFVNWYTTNAVFTTPYNFDLPVTNDFALFARWELLPVVTVTTSSGTTGYNDLTTALSAITTAGNYTVTLKEDQTMTAERTIVTAGQNITIVGEGARTITHGIPAANTNMFTVNNTTASLTLGNNITIQGRGTAGTGDVVFIQNGTFRMLEGSRITGHQINSASVNSSAVFISGANSSFEMNGGSIDGNNNAAGTTITNAGSGVYFGSGTFIMTGGSITGNTQGTEASDVCHASTAANSFTISGSSIIGALKLNATSTTLGATVRVAGWTGEITTLNLRGDIAAIATASGYWINSSRIIFNNISIGEVANIGLGEFISSDNSRQAISPAFMIADFGENIGRLVRSPAYTIPGTIVVDMFDSAGDGWDGNGSIRIDINGAQGVHTARLASGATSTFSFNVEAGDVVEFTWVSGSYHTENSFIVYHIENPPNPAFNSSVWNGENALLFRLRTQITTDNINQLLGSIIVESGNDARPPRINTQPSNIFYHLGGSAPQPALSVAAVSLDGGTLSYQWYRNTTNSTTGGTAVGTNSSAYSPDVSTLGSVFYYCVVTNTNLAAPGNTTVARTTNVVRVRVSDSAVPVIVNGDAFDDLTSAFAFIGTTPGTYEILIDDNQTLAARTLGNGMIISISSMTPTFPIEVQLTGTGSMFTVNTGASLTLEDVVLKGVSSNAVALVTVSGGTVTMRTGSEITGNTNTSASQVGGGVTMSSGTFNLNGGKIHSNTRTGAYGDGGGVILAGGTFNLNSGEISNNQAQMHGGGVYIRGTGAILNMSGGSISNNRGLSSSEGGGGIWMMSGTFSMTGGIMSGNTTAGRGGAIFVYSGTFTKTGSSIIYGNNEGTNSNTANVLTSSGHAVYVSTARFRNTTAGAGVNLDNGTAANWE